MSGIGHVEVLRLPVAVGIAPDGHVGNLVVPDRLEQHACVPVVDSHSLAASLGEGGYLAAFGGDRRSCSERVGHMPAELLDAGLATIVVDVGAQDVHIFVARIALHVFLSGVSARLVGRVRPHDVVYPLLVEDAARHVPESHVVLRVAACASPPEPVARVLVPWAEDDGYAMALVIAERTDEVGGGGNPVSHDGVEGVALGEATAHHGGVACIPRVAAREWVAQMP